MFTKVKDTLDDFIRIGIPGFDCTIRYKGDEIFRYARGYSDLEKQIPFDGNARMFFYSFTKTITVHAALQLWEKKAFSLDDPVSDYLPEFASMTVRTEDGSIVPAVNRITIRNLFTMTAGLSYELQSPSLRQAFTDTSGRCPLRETVKYLAREPLLFEPGSAWRYSLCHDVLGAVLEVVSGKKLQELFRENIFVPLDMKDSSLLLPHEEYAKLPPSYLYRDGIFRRAIGDDFGPDSEFMPWILGREYACAGAGCVTTMEDQLKIAAAVLKGDVLIRKETSDMMLTPQLTEEQSASHHRYVSTADYGLGLNLPAVRGELTWSGAGGSCLYMSRKHDLYMLYVQSTRHAPNVMAVIQLFRQIKEAMGLE